MKNVTMVYTVAPLEDSKVEVNAAEAIRYVIEYVQNHEVSFIGSGPGFVHDVLLFSIVGFPCDHEAIKHTLENTLQTVGCTIITTIIIG